MKLGGKARSADTASRMDRRKIKTRSRLMMAAYQLIAKSGLDSLIIQKLTDRADVAFGSFYNYFKSKDEIVAAVIEAAIEHTADLLDMQHSSDRPLDETLSRILRTFLKKCADDRIWAAFVARTLRAERYFEWGFGRRLRRDVLAGIEAGTFRVRDVEMAILGVSGLMIAAILDIVGGRAVDAAYAPRVVALALEILGVDRERIDHLVSLDLPTTDLPGFMQA